MKSKLLVIITSLCILSLWTGLALSWDFPLTMDVIAIKFNHGGANGALNIRKNYSTDITVPEYNTDPQRNEEFAYIKSDGYNPTVKVKFYADPADTSTSLTIDAINSVGATNWNLADTEMDFNGSGFSVGAAGDTNYVKFDTESGFPTSVQDTDVYWSWRVVAVGGTPRQSYYFDSTNHDFYVVNAAPKSPWTSSGVTEPWTDVLDYACSWASDKTSDQDIVEEITEGAYNANFKNYNGSSTYTSEGTCYLGSILQGSEADCRDMSAVVQLFSNALGVSRSSSGIQVRRIDTTSTSNGFYYKSIDPIGTPSWQGGDEDGWWYFHQVAWYYNSYVYDACLKLDNPIRIPVEENITGDYQTDLYNNNPDDGWDHYDDNEWTPQTAFSISVIAD